VSIVGVIRYRAMYFGLFDTGKDLFFENNQGFFNMWMLAFVTTSIAGFTSYPLDTVRRRMMLNSGVSGHVHIGSFKLTKKIFKEEGVRAFYKGAGVNFIRSFGGSLVLAIYTKIQNDLFKNETCKPVKN